MVGKWRRGSHSLVLQWDWHLRPLHLDTGLLGVVAASSVAVLGGRIWGGLPKRGGRHTCNRTLSLATLPDLRRIGFALCHCADQCVENMRNQHIHRPVVLRGGVALRVVVVWMALERMVSLANYVCRVLVAANATPLLAKAEVSFRGW